LKHLQEAEVATTNPPVPPQSSAQFYFRGYAVAAGGFLTRIGTAFLSLDPEKVTTHGESSLPMIGGVSRSLVPVPELNFPDHISYGACETFVEGRYAGDQTITTLRASVSGVRLATAPSPSDNVPNVRSIAFRANSLSIDAVSVYPRTGKSTFTVRPQAPDMALEITDTKGNTTTLKIVLDFDDHALSLSTAQEMDDEFLSNRQFFDRFVSRFAPLEELMFGTSVIPKTPRGFIASSFVKQIHVGDEVIPGNVLTRKGFGTIQFGVMLISPTGRRFTMAHIAMGSDPAGDADFCAVEDTGDWGN
jgi:hypothetical protein